MYREKVRRLMFLLYFYRDVRRKAELTGCRQYNLECGEKFFVYSIY